ncbi:MAG: hypothetical protein PVH88_25970, partial [Ignavibacteria bacterium]
MINFFNLPKKFYSYFSLLLVILIIILGISSPILLESFEENWNETLNERIISIENKVKIEFAAKEKYLIKKSGEIENVVRPIIKNEFDILKIFRLFDNYHNKQNENLLLINNENQLLAWNKNSYPFDFTLINNNTLTFVESDLRTYLTIKKSVGEKYYLIFLLPLEKNYHLSNEFYEKISFTESLVEKFNIPFQITYSNKETLSFDGRNHSFHLESEDGEKIGVVTFRKPSLNSELLSLSDFIITLQLILTILLILSASVLYFSFTKKINRSIFRLLSLIIYFAVLRFILFYLGIPAKFLSNDLINPSYFSSTFAFGIVKSPLEFFISVLLVLFISLAIYNYTLKYSSKNNSGSARSWIKFVFTFIVCTVLYLVTLRGLGATVRSVVYDSSIAFFKNPQLIPSIPIIFMHISVLMISVAIVIFCLVMLLLIFKSIPKRFSEGNQSIVIFLFIIFQLTAYIYDLMQNYPQGTPFLRFVFITISIVLFAGHIYFPKRSIGNYVYFLFFASFISINLLKHYNSEIERESLKLIANDLNRSNEGIVRFNVDAVISGEVSNPKLVDKIQAGNFNFNSEAFKILINSGITKVARSSFVIIQNEAGENIGEVFYPNSLNSNYRNIYSSDFYYTRKQPIVINNKIIGFLIVGGSLENKTIDNSFEALFFTYPNSLSRVALDLD